MPLQSTTPTATVTLAKARTLSLDEAIEFCDDDECVEVTPEVMRVRKVILNSTERGRARSRAKQMNK